MPNRKLKSRLHKIALNNKITDDVAKLIIDTPFLFMKEMIEEMDLDDYEKTNFYHKHFGRFYLKERVLNHIKNKIKKEENGRLK